MFLRKAVGIVLPQLHRRLRLCARNAQTVLCIFGHRITCGCDACCDVRSPQTMGGTKVWRNRVLVFFRGSEWWGDSSNVIVWPAGFGDFSSAATPMQIPGSWRWKRQGRGVRTFRTIPKLIRLAGQLGPDLHCSEVASRVQPDTCSGGRLCSRSRPHTDDIVGMGCRIVGFPVSA